MTVVNVKLWFNNGNVATLPVNEEGLLEQMSRPQHKRKYLNGIEFSMVGRAEVLE